MSGARSSEIRSVGVVGLGTMGAGIVEVFARSGLDVVGIEVDASALERGRGNLAASTGRQVARGRLGEDDQRALTERVTWSTSRSDLAGCDLVVEAVPETLELKAELFTELDGIVRPDAILATNTSALSVTAIGAATAHPERVVGMHFFNPAPVQRLVEVVYAEATDPGVREAVSALATRVGKSPVVVSDRPGFVANALLLGYLGQAVQAYDEGLGSRELIDAAMSRGTEDVPGAGLPMGPLTLIDLVGLDVCLHVLETMHEFSGDHRHEPARSLREKVAAGELGRKTGKGFYTYDTPGSGTVVDDELSPAQPPVLDGQARDRVVRTLLVPHLQDAVAMRDSGYASEQDIDTAMRGGCAYPQGPFEIMRARPELGVTA